MCLKIDAHQHFWQLSRPFDYRWLDDPAHDRIRRDFLPEDLAPKLEATGVDRTIVVQTQHDLRENDWALELAERNPFVAGVVGWVDLASLDCEWQIRALKRQPKFVGVRHVTQDERDDDFIIRDEVMRGLRVLEDLGVPFDLLFHVRHLRHAATLAERLPGLLMVIDHLGKPGIKERRINDWLPSFQAAARYPNIFCKLSGMVTEADRESWTVGDLKPYAQAALEAFGPDRLMFGSDWPVCELAASYEDVHEALKQALGPIRDDERAQIFGGTASRFYGLSEGASSTGPP
ncbi:MAG: amidohydrolase family protein [Isosphaeraceae bacterium]